MKRKYKLNTNMKMKYTAALAVAAILISVTALITVLCKEEQLAADWASTLVATLSILVMVIVGVNVYSIFDMNKMQEKFEDLKMNEDQRSVQLHAAIDQLQKKVDRNCWKLHTMATSSHMALSIQLEDWGSAALLWAMRIQNPYDTAIDDDFVVNAIYDIRTILDCHADMQINPARLEGLDEATRTDVIAALKVLVVYSNEAVVLLSQVLQNNSRPQ